MKKILVAIPVVTGVEHVRECLKSVCSKENVDVLIIDNGARTETKDVIQQYAFLPNVIVHGNPENVYVTAAWNQAMRFFLESKYYDYLIIMNSDLTMQKQWPEACRAIWEGNPELSLIPTISDDKTLMFKDITIPELAIWKTVTEGTPGVFITLSKKQCEMCFPLNEHVKIWFNDNQIYDIVRAFGSTVIPTTLLAYHHWSQTINAVPGIHAIIEQDKIAWENVVKPELVKRIEFIKSRLN